MTGASTGGGPTPFLWGVSTSAYQSEGGYNGPGQPQTNWARAEAEGRVARTGSAAEFWSRYRQDFELCSELGLCAFRMGIEWSRVQPTLRDAPGDPPDFDYAALDHYADMLACCRLSGLEPVLTLHHFVQPAWLGPDAWLLRSTVVHFERYVRESVAYVNRRLVHLGLAPVRYYLTVNEPAMLALNTHLCRQFPGAASFGPRALARSVSQLLCAHVQAFRAIHELYREQGWVRPWVSFNNYCSDLYWLDKLLLDLVFARERGISPGESRKYVLERCRSFESDLKRARFPYARDLVFRFGSLFRLLGVHFGKAAFTGREFDGFWATVFDGPETGVMDYVAVDYYDPFLAHAFRLPSFQDNERVDGRHWVRLADSLASKWWDWRVLPGGMEFFCSLYASEFARPVLIAENGMALHRRVDNLSLQRSDGLTRSRFLQMHVSEVMRARLLGTPLLGYLHWSLFDNYEWGTYSPRFGLFSLDYLRGPVRDRFDHQGDCPSETYRSLILAAGELPLSGIAG